MCTRLSITLSISTRWCSSTRTRLFHESFSRFSFSQISMQRPSRQVQCRKNFSCQTESAIYFYFIFHQPGARVQSVSAIEAQIIHFFPPRTGVVALAQRAAAAAIACSANLFDCGSCGEHKRKSTFSQARVSTLLLATAHALCAFTSLFPPHTHRLIRGASPTCIIQPELSLSFALSYPCSCFMLLLRVLACFYHHAMATRGR